LEAVKKRAPGVSKVERSLPAATVDGSAPNGVGGAPRDRVEDMLNSIVGLEHIKSQVSFV